MRAPVLVVDRTHLGRRVSGIERITEELFSDAALRPLPVEGFSGYGNGKLAVAIAQMAGAPLAMMARPNTFWAFSGFPPPPPTVLFRHRAAMYVHDLFLITRRQDLNRAAKLYMAAPFRLAVERLRYFFTNSETTAANLKPFVQTDAEIRLYRPEVRNVFDISPAGETAPVQDTIVLGAIGTIEPRKNFLAAAAIAVELGRRLDRSVELHIIGRAGWGDDHAKLGKLPHVKLHGFLPRNEARVAMARFDALICTSHDEGLGLPLVEAQYGGLQSIAPDKPVFREVLAASGLYIEPDNPGRSADRLAAWWGMADRCRQAANKAQSNIARWNDLAKRDRDLALDFLAQRLELLGGSNGKPATHVS